MTRNGREWPAGTEIDGSGPWRLAQGTHQDRPILVRINQGLREIAGHPEYPDQVRIAVRLRAPTDLGLPDEKESEDLNALEDALCEMLLEANESLLALVLTAGGVREFVFYTADREAARRKATAVGRAAGTARFRLTLHRDPDWQVFKQFA
jgi:hypothetical protein